VNPRGASSLLKSFLPKGSLKFKDIEKVSKGLPKGEFPKAQLENRGLFIYRKLSK